MTPEQKDRLQRVASLFHRARDESGEGREAFLAEACGNDAELRQEVERLLAHAETGDDAENDSSEPADGQETETQGKEKRGLAPDEPQQVGPYHLIHQLGKGGMGVVYLAEQVEPVRRRVALKLIKLGMDTREVIARFEAERQALAMMDHPNVAMVFDAGTTEHGRPYFAMEYVPGVPITDFCDRHKLPVRKRLELFAQVCAALQHAHQKGVIHRDIKPSNILVRYHDGRPVPKVIDFGVAKATSQRLTERTLFTEMGQIIGTPEYMSPEQAEMSPLDVDARTDVYSLGVLLYELLVGEPPFDSKTLRKGGYAEIQRIIREVDPPKPSTRLSTLKDRSGAISQRRQVDPGALQRQLSGDLDWITMKALEKDRTRRYETAADLASDVKRYLAEEPVTARPPSATYRLRMYVRRHRIGVALSFVPLFVVLAGLIALRYREQTRQAQRVAQAERQQAVAGKIAHAVDLMQKADHDAAAAKWHEVLADDPANYAACCNLAIIRLHQFDKAADPALLDEGLDLIDRALAADPDRPDSWNIKGAMLRRLGRLDEAVGAHERGIKADQDYFANWVSLANAHVSLGRLDEAERCLSRAALLPGAEKDDRPWLRWYNLASVQLLNKNPKAADSIAKAMEADGKQAEVHLLRAKMRILLPGHEDARQALEDAAFADNLSDRRSWSAKRFRALAHLHLKEFAAATETAQEALALQDPIPAYPHAILAAALAEQGRVEEAREHLKTVDDQWPADFAEKGVRGVVRNGLLWFETLDELRAIKDEANVSIQSTKR